MNILAIVVFVVIFSVLILVHELGHFWAARRAGVGVDEFGLGLPPRIIGRKRGDTLYSLNWIPFGGFVKLRGEGEAVDVSKKSLQAKTYSQRFWVITGGVIMNFLLGYVLIVVGMWLGMPPLAADPKALVEDPAQIVSEPIILAVEDGTPAAIAGIKPGDKLISVNGTPVASIDDFREIVMSRQEVTIEIDRNDELITLKVPTYVQDGGTRAIGIFSEDIVEAVHYEWWKVPYLAAVDLVQAIGRVAESVGRFVGDLVRTGKIDEAVSGPVGIAQITAYAVGLGLLPVLQLFAFLSINLGLINLLPFPALDGGRLVFLIVEVAMGGRRVKPVIENVIHNLGFVLLLLLILVVTYRDIVRLF